MTTITVKIQINSTKRMCCAPLLEPQPPPLPSPLVFGNHSSVFHLCNFVILRKLYQWDYIVCNLLTLNFLTQHYSLVIHLICCVSIVFSYNFKIKFII